MCDPSSENGKRKLRHEATAASTAQVQTNEWVPLNDPKLYSRLLYTNPVCILTTVDQLRQRRNAMVVSWLTPINNHGCFIMAINKQRHSASLILTRRSFCLSPGGIATSKHLNHAAASIQMALLIIIIICIRTVSSFVKQQQQQTP